MFDPSQANFSAFLANVSVEVNITSGTPASISIFAGTILDANRLFFTAGPCLLNIDGTEELGKYVGTVSGGGGFSIRRLNGVAFPALANVDISTTSTGQLLVV